jgi:uncharacterized protein YbjT (DUF2867 family)
MSSKKLITVFGATGNQGGSVIAAILKYPALSSTYSLRAITRDPSKPNAQTLAAQGVSLAKADLNDAHSITTAVQDSYAVFAVTNYWETMSKTTEIAQGKNIVDACLAAGVKHLIWSALPHASTITNGTLTKIEHFDSKADVATYAASKKSSTGMLVTNFMPGYFMSNLTTTIKPLEGTPTLSLPWNPSTWIPMLDIRTDTGKFVAGILEAGAEADGKDVHAVSQWQHPDQIVETLSKVTGQKVVFEERQATVEMTESMDLIPAELMQNMILIRDYSYYGKGAPEQQAESDRFFYGEEKKVTWEEFAGKAKFAF